MGPWSVQHPTISPLEAVPGATSSYPGSIAVSSSGGVLTTSSPPSSGAAVSAPFTLRFLSPAYVEHLSAEQGRPCSSGYRTFVQ